MKWHRAKSGWMTAINDEGKSFGHYGPEKRNGVPGVYLVVWDHRTGEILGSTFSRGDRGSDVYYRSWIENQTVRLKGEPPISVHPTTLPEAARPVKIEIKSTMMEGFD